MYLYGLQFKLKDLQTLQLRDKYDDYQLRCDIWRRKNVRLVIKVPKRADHDFKFSINATLWVTVLYCVKSQFYLTFMQFKHDDLHQFLTYLKILL